MGIVWERGWKDGREADHRLTQHGSNARFWLAANRGNSRRANERPGQQQPTRGRGRPQRDGRK
jgi:hypothetical protein